MALGGTGLSFFCIGYIFVFLIKLQTSHVGSPRTLLSASVFWVTGIRFSPAESSSTSPGLCWALGGDDRAVPGGGQGAQRCRHPRPACGSRRMDQPPVPSAESLQCLCVALQRTKWTSLDLSPACPLPSTLPTLGPGSPTPWPFQDCGHECPSMPVLKSRALSGSPFLSSVPVSYRATRAEISLI